MGGGVAMIAAVVARATGRKLLLPLTQEGVEVVGGQRQPLPRHMRSLVNQLKEMQADV